MRKGFTFVELMVVLAISSVVAAGIFAVLSSTRVTWYISDASVQLQQELRKTMSAISDELRESSAAKLYLDSSLDQAFPGDGTSQSSITFFIVQGVDTSGAVVWSDGPVSYVLSGNQIIRTYDGVSKVIANNISSVSFVRHPESPNVVSINIIAQKATEVGQTIIATLDTQLALRN